jgi:hypothetical protein
MPASFQLSVPFVEQNVTEERRERPALWRALRARRRHQPALHHPRLQIPANQEEHSCVLHPSRHACHQHVVIDAVKNFSRSTSTTHR